MNEFKKGQRVRVELEGVAESMTSGKQGLYVHPGAAEHPGAMHWIRLDAPNVKVTLLDPPGWPPQVGDIWEAEGREWFARKSPTRTPVCLVPESDLGTREMDDFKALNPVLVRRRGQ